VEPSTASVVVPLSDASPRPLDGGCDRLLRDVQAESLKGREAVERGASEPIRRTRLYVVPTPPRDREQPVPTPTFQLGSPRPDTADESSES
jgi:hypothetical protein